MCMCRLSLTSPSNEVLHNKRAFDWWTVPDPRRPRHTLLPIRSAMKCVVDSISFRVCMRTTSLLMWTKKNRCECRKERMNQGVVVVIVDGTQQSIRELNEMKEPHDRNQIPSLEQMPGGPKGEVAAPHTLSFSLSHTLTHTHTVYYTLLHSIVKLRDAMNIDSVLLLLRFLPRMRREYLRLTSECQHVYYYSRYEC